MVGLTVCVHYVTLCDVSGPFTLRGLHVTLFNRVESCFKGKATLFIYLHKSALLADFFFWYHGITECLSLSLKKKSLLRRAQQCELLEGVCVNPKDILCYVGALFHGCSLERMNLKESVFSK